MPNSKSSSNSSAGAEIEAEIGIEEEEAQGNVTYANNATEMKNKDLPFAVPEGYFDNLTERIMQRCDGREVAHAQRLHVWSSIRAQLAFAAGFALLVGLSYVAVRYATTLMQPDADLAYDAYYGFSIMDLENLLLEDADGSNADLDDEAIVDYLLCDNQIQIPVEE